MRNTIRRAAIAAAAGALVASTTAAATGTSKVADEVHLSAGAPFGAAEYIGDITSDRHGKAKNSFHLIVQEAFASTLVDGNRVRVDLNQVGMWFVDPTSDDLCLGANSPVTPFDGDNEAGVQAFNSANAAPLPAP